MSLYLSFIDITNRQLVTDLALPQRESTIVGVAIVGRPVARNCDQKYTAEVTRLCTDGTSNACSFLYALCAKIAKLMGFTKIQTYILASEPGTSLLAAGWIDEGPAGGGNWNGGNRTNRRTDQPMERKRRYAKYL